jgi:pimeloyl-ACP methyl ester carboxylesterase
VTLHIRSFGDGPAVALLHGCPVPSDHLEPLALALAVAGFRAILVDLPGYGASAALPEPYSFDRAAAAIEHAFGEERITELAIVGHSLGAYRAFHLAVRGRVRINAVVSLCGMLDFVDEERRGFVELAQAVRAGADLRDVLVSRYLSPGFRAAEPDASREVRGWYDHFSLSVVAAELEAVAGAADLRPMLRDLGIAILARVGELDVSAPVQKSKQITGSVPGAELEIVPNVGHLLLTEDFPSTRDSVLAFLARSARAAIR